MTKNISLIIKRGFDIIIALGGLIILSPLMLICAVLIRIKLGKPIFFKQERIGKDNKPFQIIKFRTMKDAYDSYGKILPDELRLTSFGSKLRSWSIDELPELLNILKGDMSLIGPRPLLPEYLPLYSKTQIRRHEVLPGITGLAQIKGRNNLSWNKKFEFDVYYIDHWSILLDIKIFFLTFYKIFKKEGINKEGCATCDDFNGNNE